MNRERKIGTVLTVAGVLTLPVFIGIPLLLVGLVLLVRGTRVDAERWIHVLFRIVLSALALTPPTPSRSLSRSKDPGADAGGDGR